MRKIYLSIFLLATLCMVAAGCATKQPLSDFRGADLEGKLRSGQYKQKTDNFLIVLDSSGSLSGKYQGRTKLNIAKEVVNRMNRTIPEMELTGALRTFGMAATPLSYEDKTDLLYGVTKYSTADFEAALDGIWPPNGRSPMGLAFAKAGEDLADTKGSIAIMVVSDAQDMDMSPVEGAKALKARYGDRLCIYTMHIGNNSEGKAKMDMISEAGKCGFTAIVDDISTQEGMADFVTGVFLEKVGTAPAPKPKPAPVPAALPAPKDTDGDGVFDKKDDCPNTPKAAKVNSVGCWVLKGLNFNYDKWDIKPKYNHLLDELVTILKNNPTMKLEVQGHTDNRGTAAYNKSLSKKRADSVRDYLVGKGIGAARLTTAGYGFDKPAATNDTDSGRAENRRVELKPIR